MSEWTSYLRGRQAQHVAFGAMVTVVALGFAWALLADSPREMVSTLRVPAAAIGIHDAADFAAESVNDFDDGWRKTADGWEHISTWEHPPIVAPRELIVLPPRDVHEVTKYDLHPCAWTMLMICVSLAALSFLPGSSPPDNA